MYICIKIFFMEKKSAALTLAGITGTMLMAAGAYYIISDLLGDKAGLMFEGIVAWSLGIIMAAIVVIAERIKRAHNKFADVFDRQAEIQQYLTQKFNEERMEKQRLANMMRNNMTLPGADGTPKNVDMNDPNNMMKAMNDAFKFYSTWDGNFWTLTGQSDEANQEKLEELEDELAKAVAAEDFEKAKKIKEKIAAIKNLEKPDETDPDEPGGEPE
jgi:hypothetical protein